MLSNSKFPGHYATMGVPENATFRTIEAAYWLLTRRLTGKELDELNAAYEVLGNERKRDAYDAELRRRPPAQEKLPAPARPRARIFDHFGAR